MKWIVIGIAGAFISMSMLVSGEGIILLESWPDGVAMCDGEEGQNEEMVTQVDDYHMWMEEGIQYVVNYGHLQDPELPLLKRSALKECKRIREVRNGSNSASRTGSSVR